MRARGRSSSKSGAGAPPRLAIEMLALHALKPDPGNARRHSARQIGRIAKSIAAFGFNAPILVDADLNVIAGHGRLMAARRLGLSEAPVIRVRHLSEAQRKAFMIADNRLAECARWDDRLLAEGLKALTSAELDFDIEAIGFDVGEIELRVEWLEEKGASSKAPDDKTLTPDPLYEARFVKRFAKASGGGGERRPDWPPQFGVDLLNAENPIGRACIE